MTGASRFLIGLVTRFATHGGIPAVARVQTQSFSIWRYIAWRNRHAQDRVLREVVERANIT